MAHKESSDTLQSLGSKPTSTVYHIYHTGNKKQNYSIHTISDSRTFLTDTHATIGKGKSERPLNDPSLWARRHTWSSISTKVKRAKYIEKPAHDPRTETSPYYLQLPTLYGHCPPLVLRHGGNKGAPPAVLMDQSLFWKKWTMQIGDVLAEDGVIDGRGVVNIKYGTEKGDDETLKGYPVRKRRYWGESGKKWHAMQKTVKEKPTEPTTRLKPEEVIEMFWASPFSTRTREYHFVWRGFTFKWKGTKDVRPAENIFQHLWLFMRYSHLKLVVVDESGKELVLAQYRCVPASRKAGRLELYQEAIDDFLVDHIYAMTKTKSDDEKKIAARVQTRDTMTATDEKAVTAQVQTRDTKTDQRLQELLVASAMCMIISEWQKRQVIIQLILAAANAGG